MPKISTNNSSVRTFSDSRTTEDEKGKAHIESPDQNVIARNNHKLILMTRVLDEM